MYKLPLSALVVFPLDIIVITSRVLFLLFCFVVALSVGAGGGVGSVAIALLSRLGYRAYASTGRVAELGDYMHELGG